MIAADVAEPTALHTESAAGFLARTPLFSDIDPELHDQLAAKSHTRHLAAGQWLFREHDTPNSFVWEIGHTSDFTTPAARFCVAGQSACDSYDTAHWLGFSPLQIKSVTFAGGSGPSRWAVVSDLGGIAEVNATCPAYGGPFRTYPWYALNAADQAFTFGADYRGTKFDYGHAAQFATTPLCGGPFGPGSTFCDTLLSPTP